MHGFSLWGRGEQRHLSPTSKKSRFQRNRPDPEANTVNIVTGLSGLGSWLWMNSDTAVARSRFAECGERGGEPYTRSQARECKQPLGYASSPCIVDP